MSTNGNDHGDKTTAGKARRKHTTKATVKRPPPPRHANKETSSSLPFPPPPDPHRTTRKNGKKRERKDNKKRGRKRKRKRNGHKIRTKRVGQKSVPRKGREKEEGKKKEGKAVRARNGPCGPPCGPVGAFAPSLWRACAVWVRRARSRGRPPALGGAPREQRVALLPKARHVEAAPHRASGPNTAKKKKNITIVIIITMGNIIITIHTVANATGTHKRPLRSNFTPYSGRGFLGLPKLRGQNP